ncbi:hypothetical protein MG293_012814 [Ovis ammon polii]|uniref:Uncharacterized protein n=1 Tax=Ovis ammon polii TaxID=230172 RepID=A0AAD4U177_OVIAM|nr:hypothetical protein MG293_012814 [Ovis ammon polii]
MYAVRWDNIDNKLPKSEYDLRQWRQSEVLDKQTAVSTVRTGPLRKHSALCSATFGVGSSCAVMAVKRRQYLIPDRNASCSCSSGPPDVKAVWIVRRPRHGAVVRGQATSVFKKGMQKTTGKTRLSGRNSSFGALGSGLTPDTKPVTQTTYWHLCGSLTGPGLVAVLKMAP